ncbi:MAG: peptidase M14 [Vicinamibacteria bacterium]|nr:peptidase M14 [Vicinamibacteria bacterium]
MSSPARRPRLLSLPLLNLASALLLYAPGFAAPQTGPRAPAKAAPTWPLTRPESTNYAETSRYDEVVAFMKAMAAASPGIHLTTYGYTFEGRPMPLAVIGAPDATAAAVLKTGKTRVFIQGNIHAGEVEGKEALLWLLRSIAKGERASWFKDVVLLVSPIYNADGNERVSVANRGAQLGPIGGMGTRPNAQGLNLNRDAMKLETAEARSLARLLNDYDPHIDVDLHTTDGSDHGYYLTYDPGGSPNTSKGVTSLLRENLLPAVTRAVKAKHGWDFFYYGGASARGGERAWYGDLDLYKPRYTHTYFGLRNRLGILSETYSYANFEDRIKAAYWFVEEIVNFAAGNGEAIRKATAAADAESIIGTEQMVRGKLSRFKEPVAVVLADTKEERNPYVPDRPMRRRVNGSERLETMPHYGLIEPTETGTAPRAFLIQAPSPTVPAANAAPPAAPGPPFGPPRDPATRMMAAIIDRLEAHGVRYFKTAAETTLKVERYRIESSKVEEREFEGHKLRTLTGAWQPGEETLRAGSLVVPMDQPLARLAFLLLDARSDDGLMAWNVLDPLLGQNPGPQFYPVLRTMETIAR